MIGEVDLEMIITYGSSLVPRRRISFVLSKHRRSTVRYGMSCNPRITCTTWTSASRAQGRRREWYVDKKELGKMGVGGVNVFEREIFGWFYTPLSPLAVVTRAQQGDSK